MASASFRAHAAVPFMNPLSEADVDGAIAALALPPGARVLDTGCGAGQLLLRVLEAHPEATGVGVDPDADSLARARADAEARVPGRAPELIEAPAQDAGLPPGSFDLVVNVAASHAHGGFPDALDELAALARPGGGLVLLGEGYWMREPSDAFLAALGGATADELPLGLDALIAAARAAGLEPLAVAEATEADWAAYEEGLAAEAERYEDEDARAYARRIRERRALPGGASTFGFALLTLRR
ncbi:MAG TPA: class I SAM-dependent methyltransferase [Baekduia sp.]|uniref:class I SAM-dependent methyltransferase n=1 Tax=Baekduia sp. TaxID=2600305 RepID=UPI002C51C51D|nr:class I SAM-dependent methyltransferase [Baekduia sp.]HMJ32288.1 class I SAM-dependent methyltransferase [Baekduia sp.]